MPNQYKCFFCGERFYEYESTARKTPKIHARTYCTPECYEEDLKQMESDAKQQVEELEAAPNPEQVENPNTKIEDLNVGGFNLKVRMPVK